MSKNNVAVFGIGLGVGLLTGAIIALLYAPKSGHETRQLIKEKAHEVVVSARGKLGHDVK